MFEPGSPLDRAIDHAMAEADRLGGPERLPMPVRTVLLVHAAQGVIDNGGLQYFFEMDWPGQPPYSTFVDAYRAIGADVEAAALADAVRLFPFADPHTDQDRRDRFLGRFMDDGSHRLDSPFEPLTDLICGSEAVWPRLASYVAKHAAAFPV